jgi:hypothetical protein
MVGQRILSGALRLVTPRLTGASSQEAVDATHGETCAAAGATVAQRGRSRYDTLTRPAQGDAPGHAERSRGFLERLVGVAHSSGEVGVVTRRRIARRRALIPLSTDPSAPRAISRDAATWRAPRLFHTDETRMSAR